MGAESSVAEALRILESTGLLMLSDPRLPSVTGLIVGAPIHRSWWGHPQGGLIYYVVQSLAEHPHVLSTKLIAGKVTFVHRRLWPSVYSVGRSRAAWQVRQLSDTAAWLLDELDDEGEIATTDVPIESKRAARAALDLERRLLVRATEIHTPSGAHARVLQSWPHWAARAHVQAIDPAAARRNLKQAANQLGPAARLPWTERPRS